MTRSKRILISGYYGFSNAGDEAVLSAIIAGLRSHGDMEIAALSASPRETAGLHGIEALPRASLPGTARALRQCDLLISGGGSLIQDATSFRSLAYYLAVIRLAKLCRRRVMILGQGIGPLRRSISRRVARRVLNGVDLITVRDTKSAELLRELGVKRPPVHVTADPTFLLGPCPPDESARLLSEAGIETGEDVIAVSLRSWPETPAVEQAGVEALTAIARKLPAKLLLVTMHTPDDEPIARRVSQAVGAAVQPRPWAPDQLLGVFQRSRLVIGMRLHALIFAASVGTPFLGIAYDPKVTSFIAAAGQEGIALEGLTSGLLADRIGEAWNDRSALASRLSEKVPPMREAAAENFRLAAEL